MFHPPPPHMAHFAPVHPGVPGALVQTGPQAGLPAAAGTPQRSATPSSSQAASAWDNAPRAPSQRARSAAPMSMLATAPVYNYSESSTSDALASQGWTGHYEQQRYVPPSEAPTPVPQGADSPASSPAKSAGSANSLPQGGVVQQHPSPQASSAGPMAPQPGARTPDKKPQGPRLVNTLSNVSIARKPNQRSQAQTSPSTVSKGLPGNPAIAPGTSPGTSSSTPAKPPKVVTPTVPLSLGMRGSVEVSSPTAASANEASGSNADAPRGAVQATDSAAVEVHEISEGSLLEILLEDVSEPPKGHRENTPFSPGTPAASAAHDSAPAVLANPVVDTPQHQQSESKLGSDRESPPEDHKNAREDLVFGSLMGFLNHAGALLMQENTPRKESTSENRSGRASPPQETPRSNHASIPQEMPPAAISTPVSATQLTTLDLDSAKAWIAELSPTLESDTHPPKPTPLQSHSPRKLPKIPGLLPVSTPSPQAVVNTNAGEGDEPSWGPVPQWARMASRPSSGNYSTGLTPRESPRRTSGSSLQARPAQSGEIGLENDNVLSKGISAEHKEKAAAEKHKAEEEARKKREAEEEARRRQEAAAKQKAEEEARKKREAEEEARRRQVAAAKQKAEEEARKKREAEEEARRRQEAAAKQKAEEEARKKREAEEKARRRQEAAAKQKAEEEARKKREAEEEARRRQEAAAKQKAEEEARKKRGAEEDARRRQEAAAKQKAKEEARKKREAEEDARRRQEAAAKQKAEEEARKKRETEEEAQNKSNASSSTGEGGENGANGAVVETAGVGMVIGRTNDQVIVVNSVAPGGPAAKAGIRPGCRLVAVNDVSVAGLRTAQIHNLIKGPVGSKVKMTVAMDVDEQEQSDMMPPFGEMLIGSVGAGIVLAAGGSGRPPSSSSQNRGETKPASASPSLVTMGIVRAKLDQSSPSRISTPARMVEADIDTAASLVSQHLLPDSDVAAGVYFFLTKTQTQSLEVDATALAELSGEQLPAHKTVVADATSQPTLKATGTSIATEEPDVNGTGSASVPAAAAHRKDVLHDASETVCSVDAADLERSTESAAHVAASPVNTIEAANGQAIHLDLCSDLMGGNDVGDTNWEIARRHRAEAVEQDNSEEQQWQHEVQVVEDQRAAAQRQQGSAHGADDESQEPGRDGSKGGGVDDNRRNSLPLQEPSSPVPESLRPDGDGIDGIQRRKSVPDQQSPSPLHLQLQMFEAKAEASGPLHDEASVKTETVHQDASWFQPTTGSTISLRGLTPIRVNWLTASGNSTMNGHQTGTVGLAAERGQLQGFRTNSDVIDRNASVVVAPWTPRGSTADSSSSSFAVSSSRKTPRVLSTPSVLPARAASTATEKSVR